MSTDTVQLQTGILIVYCAYDCLSLHLVNLLLPYFTIPFAANWYFFVCFSWTYVQLQNKAGETLLWPTVTYWVQNWGPLKFIFSRCHPFKRNLYNNVKVNNMDHVVLSKENDSCLSSLIWFRSQKEKITLKCCSEPALSLCLQHEVIH